MIIFYLFVGLFGLVFLISFLSSKFMSPYRLTYLFGLKGAGKSTFMAKLMLEDICKGWTVYTNMTDVVIPGVHIFQSKQLENMVPPPRSSVYIDEAGLVWDNRKFKDFNDGFIEYFKLQRKYKNKVTMNSQALDVDKKIRDLIDSMYLCSNLFGCIGICRPLKRTIKVLEAQGNSESRLAMNLIFEGITKIKIFWMPRYWKWFDSFKAPARPHIVGDIVPGDPPEKKTFRQLLRLLQRNFSSK